MSMSSESLSKDPSTVQQRRQANILLLRMQWLVILLLIAALLWLYISQQRFQHSISERLQSNEQVISRLNEMDDRLFAMSQQTLPAPSIEASSQAQNQLDLLRIQMQAADRLLADNNDSAAIELLRGLHWQLAQSSNEIAPALSVVIKQSLLKDIERLQAQRSQLSPWQMQNLAIQNIQAFLHSHELGNSHELDSSHELSKTPERSVAQQQKTIAARTEGQPKRTATTKAIDNNATLTRKQLMIHEVIMTLNLASQSSNMREQDQLISYLRQAREQLKALVPNSMPDGKKLTNAAIANTEQAASGRQSDTSSPYVKSNQESTRSMESMTVPNDIAEVIDQLGQLIINAPKPTPLLTTQILDKPQR